jgi:hypothetical protein
MRISFLAAVAIVALAGCESKQPDPTDIRGQITGVWLEAREAEGSPKVGPGAVVKPKSLQLLTINADGTYVLQLAEANGNPIGSKAVKGKWTWKRYAQFTVDSNDFDAAIQGLAPETSAGAMKVDLEGKGSVTQLSVTSTGKAYSVFYKRE